MHAPAQTNLVDIDAAAFAEAFARHSVAVRHRLAEHSLFTIDAIAELADRLPPESVRRERGALPFKDREYVDVGDGPPSETIRNVERTGTRISLRDIQQVPEYAELINECLDEVDPLVAERQGGMTQRAGLPVHLLLEFDHPDALRSGAQLPIAGEGCEACERGRFRGRSGRPTPRIRLLDR